MAITKVTDNMRDTTSLDVSKLSGAVAVAKGGTGATTHTANNVLVGNGTSAIASVAPSTSGNVLTSNGSAWTSTAPAGGGAWTLIGTSVASNSASLTITGLDSTYDSYGIGLSDIIPATDGTEGWLRCGDSGGVDSGASDYGWHIQGMDSGNSSYGGANDIADSQIDLTRSAVGNATGEGLSGMLYLNRPADGTMYPTFTGTVTCIDSDGMPFGGAIIASRLAVITLDRINFQFASGNVTSGRMTVWGIAHA